MRLSMCVSVVVVLIVFSCVFLAHTRSLRLLQSAALRQLKKNVCCVLAVCVFVLLTPCSVFEGVKQESLLHVRDLLVYRPQTSTHTNTRTAFVEDLVSFRCVLVSKQFRSAEDRFVCLCVLVCACVLLTVCVCVCACVASLAG